MKQFVIWSVIALALAGAFAHGQTTFHEATPGSVAVGSTPIGTAPTPPDTPATTTVNVPPPATVQNPATPATTQNTVTTTGPVSSETTISVGTLAGQAFLWMVTAFGGVLGTALTALILKLIKAAGIQATDALRARLQEMVVNGLNLAAQEAAAQLKGKMPVEVNAQIKARATEYVMAHGAETIKALGIEPRSAQATEAVRAHIETAIADPAVPTPVILDKPKILN